jgi:hypothetical protein
MIRIMLPTKFPTSQHTLLVATYRSIYGLPRYTQGSLEGV